MAKRPTPKKKVTATVHASFTAEDAKKLLGWTVEGEGQDFGSDYVCKDEEGRKVRFTNNPNNRPFRPTLAKRYANEILRRKWKLNGEPIITDRLDRVQSGQHRLAGLIFAEQERKARPKTVAERYGWRGPVSIGTVVVHGISERRDVVDTLDLGQKRSLGDVVYRRHEFKTGKALAPADVKKLSNILAGAIRLCWLRSGGKTVSDAKHFPHSEALDYLEAHPRLVDAVTFVYEEDRSEEGSRIRSKLSLAYAAAMLYLAATSKTNVEKADEPNTSLWDKACEFWVLFASGAGLDTGHPALSLSKALARVEGSGAKDRDRICGMVVKAYNAFFDKSEITTAELRIKERVNRDTGKRELAEEPRLGGYDIVVEPDVISEVDGWKEGDTAWVADPAGAWFGTIQGFADLETAEVYSAEDEDSYMVPVTDLRTDKPDEDVDDETG